MLFKKYLRISFAGIKAQHIFAFVPVVVAYVLIPLLNLLFLKKYGVGDDLYISIICFTQLLLPFFSVWWVFFMMREYVEGAGSELLYVCDKNGQIITVVMTWLIYIIMLVPLYTVYFICFRMMALEFVRIICESLLMLGLLYICINLLNSTSLSVIPVFLYIIANISAKNESVFLYYTLNEISGVSSLKKYFIQALFGAVMLLAGEICSRIRRKVNWSLSDQTEK